MEKPDDFCIKDGELIKYSGPGGDVTIPEGVTMIRAMAFEYCYDLTGVKLPESLEEIGYEAFSGCKNLAKINFPEKLKTDRSCLMAAM